LLDNVKAAAAKWDRDKREMFAQWIANGMRTWPSKPRKYGLGKISTGNESLDRMLGNASDRAKNAGRDFSDGAKNWGADSSDQFNKITGGLVGSKKPGKPSGRVLRTSRNRNYNRNSTPRSRTWSRRSTPGVLTWIRNPRFVPRMENHTLRTSRELHVRFEHCVAGSAGDGGGSVGLIVNASSFRAQVNSRQGQADRGHDSAVVAVSISFANLVGEPNSQRPTASIAVDAFADASGLNAPTRVRHKLQELVELYLPEVEIEGRKKFVEKRVSIHNPHDEPLRVWVQIENRFVRDRAFQWKWDPGQPATGNAFRFVIPAKTERPMTLRYENGHAASSKKDRCTEAA